MTMGLTITIRLFAKNGPVEAGRVRNDTSQTASVWLNLMSDVSFF